MTVNISKTKRQFMGPSGQISTHLVMFDRTNP